LVNDNEEELEDDDEGLWDEHEDLTRVLNYYEEKFGVSVGIMPAVVDTDEIEMDLILDINSVKILGIRMFQFVPVEEDEESEEEVSEDQAGEKDEDVEEDALDVYVTDLTKAGTEPVEGNVLLIAEVHSPVPCDENGDEETSKDESKEIEEDAGNAEKKDWVNISIYCTDPEAGILEFTGGVLFYVDDPDTKITFLSNEELEN